MLHLQPELALQHVDEGFQAAVGAAGGEVDALEGGGVLVQPVGRLLRQRRGAAVEALDDHGRQLAGERAGGVGVGRDEHAQAQVRRRHQVGAEGQGLALVAVAGAPAGQGELLEAVVEAANALGQRLGRGVEGLGGRRAEQGRAVVAAVSEEREQVAGHVRRGRRAGGGRRQLGHELGGPAQITRAGPGVALRQVVGQGRIHRRREALAGRIGLAQGAAVEAQRLGDGALELRLGRQAGDLHQRLSGQGRAVIGEGRQGPRAAHPARSFLAQIGPQGADAGGVALHQLAIGALLEAGGMAHQLAQLHRLVVALVAHLVGLR